MVAENIPLSPTIPMTPAAQAVRAEAITQRVIRLSPHYIGLGLVLLLAAVLNFWQLDRLGYANSFYAAAVRSMLLNWHNFFFNSFDPNGFVTIDKPPLGFWFQVASAKILGYSGFSILLPEALAGIGSVAIVYHLVRRIMGIPGGLLAGLFMALTPIAVADNRNNTIDSILVLFLLLAAWAISRAVETGKLRWLMACVVLVGLGFNIKMLEAYLVVPAFGLMYLLGSRLRWRTRFLHLVMALVVMLAVSLSWAVAVDLTPANQRPWVDSTTTNSELDLALGYNGLQRLLGMSSQRGAPRNATASAAQNTSSTTNSATASTGAASTGSTTNTTMASSTTKVATGSGSTITATGSRAVQQTAGQQGTGGAGGGGLFNNGPAGIFRLFDGQLGGQASWLLPLALLGIVVAASRRVRFPLDRQQQAVVMWGAWLVTVGAFFSVAGFFHPYYLVTLAPAAAALAAIALVTLYRDYTAKVASWRGWALPVALLITAAGQVAILSNFPTWSSWLTPLVVGTTGIAAGALVVIRLRGKLRLGLCVAAIVAGTAGLLIAPAAWAFDTVSSGSSGGIPSAGPSASGDNGGPGGFNRNFSGFNGGNPPGSSNSVGNSSAAGGTPPDMPNGSSGPQFGSSATGVVTGTNQAGGFGNGPTGVVIGTNQTGNGFANGGPSGIPSIGGTGSGGPGNASVNQQLVKYLEQHQGTTTYLLAVSNSNTAAPYIIQTGKAVMSLGGFGGDDPILTTAHLKALIKNNTVRYFMTGGMGGGGGNSTLSTWVQNNCTAISSSAWQSTTSGSTAKTGSSTSATTGNRSFGQQQLYDCAITAQTGK